MGTKSGKTTRVEGVVELQEIHLNNFTRVGPNYGGLVTRQSNLNSIQQELGSHCGVSSKARQCFFHSGAEY